MDKRKLTTYGLLSGVLILVAWAASAMPRARGNHLVSDDATAHADNHTPPKLTIPQKPPRVELVFALDTTGSMTGLIDGAKRKILVDRRVHRARPAQAGRAHRPRRLPRHRGRRT